MTQYICTTNNGQLPEVKDLNPFRAIVIADEEVSDEWQSKASKWLVTSGCLYMMAWGIDCSSWDDSVSQANIDLWNDQEIPDESFVMTTWHENEPIEEVFWYAKHTAFHSTVEINNMLIFHISHHSKEKEFKNMYKFA